MDEVPARFERDGDRFALTREWRLVASGRLEHGDVLGVSVDDASFIDERLEADALLDGLAELTSGPVELDTVLPMLRHVAWRRGFDGPLRGPLRAEAIGEAREPVLPPPDAVAGAIRHLLPGSTVTAATSGSAGGAAIWRATHGEEMVKLTVSRETGEGTWTVPVPHRPDLMPEPVARSIDLAMAVRRRFAAHLPQLHSLAFDRSQPGFLNHQTAGVALGNVAMVKINAAYVTVGGYTALHHRMIPHGGGHRGAPPPWTRVEATVAHELWHVVDLGFQARSYRDSIELRKRIGEYFGVETIEHLVNADRPGAPARQREGMRRLVAEVSAYAATNPLETTAELFKLWWCRGEQVSGAVQHFATVLDEFF